MEENRLKPMKENYNRELFNQLFKDTEALRRKLASEIDCRRFGVEYSDIISWFNIKFIFVFNRYSGEMPNDRLKGFIINAIKNYKNKILRYSYQNKYLLNPVSFIESYEMFEGITEEYGLSETQETFLNLTHKFMKMKLSGDAYQVFDLQLTPPPFIIERMKLMEKSNLNRIPPLLIAEFLGLGTSIAAERYINELRLEIKRATEEAKIILG